MPQNRWILEMDVITNAQLFMKLVMEWASTTSSQGNDQGEAHKWCWCCKEPWLFGWLFFVCLFSLIYSLFYINFECWLAPFRNGSNCTFLRIIIWESVVVLCRPDRDQFLDVYRNNVNPNMWDQYQIPESRRMKALQRDIPYDYFSVMQYGKYAFAKKDAYVSIKIGF